MSERRLHEV